MVMVTMMVNVCDDDCYLVMKVILVKEVMSCDVSPVAMFTFSAISKMCAKRFSVVCIASLSTSTLNTLKGVSSQHFVPLPYII